MTYHSKRNFSLLTIGQFISIVGDRISMAVFVSIAAMIVANAQTTYQSSIVIIFQTMPFLLFGYLFGLMADLVEKRKILIYTDIGRALILVTLYFYHESLWFLYLCIFCLGFLTAMFDPAKKSILPFLVRKDQLVFFNKFYAIIEIVAMMIGLGFGTFLLSKIGISKALLIDSSTYIFSCTLLLFLSYKDENEKLANKKKENFKQLYFRHIKELKEGWNYLIKNDNVKIIIFVLVFLNFLGVSILSSSIIDFSIRTFEIGKIFLNQIGFNSTNFLVGSHTTFVFIFVAIGGLLSPIFKYIFNKVKESTLSIFVFISGALVIFTGVGISYIVPLKLFYPILLFILVLMGIIVGMQYIRVNYLIQMHTEKKYMGRVMSISEILWSLSTFIGFLFGAFICELFTFKIGFVFGGIVYLISAISIFLLMKKINW